MKMRRIRLDTPGKLGVVAVLILIGLVISSAVTRPKKITGVPRDMPGVIQKK